MTGSSKYWYNLFAFLSVLSVLYITQTDSGSRIPSADPSFIAPPDTGRDTTDLPYPFVNNNPLSNQNNNPLFLSNPPNIKTEVEYDPATNSYSVVNKLGDSIILDRQPAVGFDQYLNYDLDRQLQDYWKQRVSGEHMTQGKGLIPKINVGGEAFDRIFGSSTIDIRPQGTAELIFGIKASRRDDPSLDVKLRRQANFDFQEKIQMNVTAKIGDKIQLGTNYNTEATFEFENKMKLEYEGKEDEIIKKIEAGNVTLPLNGSLITGSQALFGLKTQLQFGKTTVTTVFSQQKSKTSTIEVSGGAQTSKFEIKADQYEENKHFFLSNNYRDRYETALAKLPIISSNINITKMEVWVTSIGPAVTENRNIVAFLDLGEGDPNHIYNTAQFTPTAGGTSLPRNNANNLYATMSNTQVRNINTVNTFLSGTAYNLVSGIDYEKVENARKLAPTEYTFNSKLGFISMNTSLNPD
ncbi:MAG: cell surface protein SprA, partial [Bacteroidota bacterium]